MNRLKIWTVLYLLLVSCTKPQLQNAKINSPNQGQFFTVPINPEGYIVHPLTGDSIETPEYLQRGLPFEDNQIKVDEKELTRWPIKKIYEQPLGTPRQSEISTANYKYRPGKKYAFEVTQGEIKRKQFVHLNGEDSIFTRTPFYLPGRELDIEHPKPVKAEKSYWEKSRDHQITHWQNLQGLQSNYLWHVLEDKNGSIWMGTEGYGISKFDGEYFHNYGVDNGLNTGLTMRLFTDSQDNIWIATFGGGFLKYDGNKFFAYDKKAGFYEIGTETIYEDKEGNIWVGSNSLLGRMTGDTMSIFSEAEGFNNESVGSIFQDVNNDLWLGGYQGLCRFDGQYFHDYSLPGFDSPVKVFTGLEDSSGILWFGLWNNGLLRFDGESFEHITTDHGLLSNYISQIVEDQNGTLWFSSFEGLCSFDGESFEHITEESGLANRGLFGLGLTKDNSILIGQNGGGLGLLKQRGISHLSTSEGFFANEVTARVEYGDIIFYGGAFGDGITVQKGNELENYTTEQGLMADLIRSLAVDQNGLLYVGAQASGYGVFDGKTYRHFEIDNELYDGITTVIFMDSKERLWLGLSENGTGYVEGDEFVNINPQDGLVSSRIYGINEDSKGNIWLYSSKGISKYDGESLTNYTRREGLVQDQIKQVAEDESGVIWISSANHLTRLDSSQLQYMVDMDGALLELGGLMAFSGDQVWLGAKDVTRLTFHGDSIQAISMSNTSGLKNQEFKLFTKSQEGLLFSGGENGYDIINPDEFKGLIAPPALYLSHLEINGIFQDLTQWSELTFTRYSNVPSNLQLSPNQTHVTIHFAANQWAAHDRVEYSYRMQGVDKSWSEPSKESKADYRNLPYGEEHFMVRARGENGSWSKPLVFEFSIRPPWHLTSSAKIIYVILAILGIVAIVKIRTFQLKRKQKQLESEIKAATKEMAAQRDRAEQSERYKEQFLANMSHEIRTPIHAISGMLKILRRNSHPAFQDQFLNAMSQSTENLSKLLNDVLDLSKIESGKLTIVNEPFNLLESVRLSVELLNGKAEEKGLSLELLVSEEVSKMAQGDALRLNQVLINLINNAIKFSEQGKITISVKTESNGIRFGVRDEGTGISEDDQQRIFKSFEQVQGQHAIEGTGLGLAITQQLIELQGGTLELASEKGKGSEFAFTLPLKKYDGELQEMITSEEELQAIGKKLKPLKILLVEDTEFNVMVAKDDLSWYFPESSVEVAMNGEEALKMYSEAEYDLVLMDVQMPGMDGYQSTRKIRELESNENLEKKPIIAVTASLLKKDIQKCLDAGMDDYLPKPYRSDELVFKIAKNVNKQPKQ